VGRLGQAILVYVSWKVFSDYVTTSMELSPVTYRTFWTIFIQRDVTVPSTANMLHDFISRRGLTSKVAMVFMISTMVYLLMFPTLASAMTGYTGNVKAFISDANQTFLPFSEFIPMAFIIHDGARVNLTDEYQVLARATPYSGGKLLWKWQYYRSLSKTISRARPRYVA